MQIFIMKVRVTASKKCRLSVSEAKNVKKLITC